LFLTFFSSIC